MFEEGCSNAQGGASSATDDTFRGVERFVARRLAAVGDNMEESSSLANLLLLQRRAAQKRSVQGGVAGGRLGAVVLDEALVHDEDALVDTLSKARSLGASYVALNASAGAMRDSLPALLDILGGKYADTLFSLTVDPDMVGRAQAELLEQNGNVIPLMKCRATREATDGCLGVGYYSDMLLSLELLASRGVFAGVVMVVDGTDVHAALEAEQVEQLVSVGCSLICYMPRSLVEEGDGQGISEVARALSMHLPELRGTRRSLCMVDGSALSFGSHMDGFPGRRMDGLADAF